MPPNALSREKSPYLRQHADNPVDWLPWGEQAFEKARREDKPIFLSVGYSTCHWCHVMAHESFENNAVAEVLNRDFVPVKVDREERPDVDRVYMLFVQATSGSGGWPMSVWLTPELRPFFGGTYYPPDSRYGRPGFLDVLHHLGRAWREERRRIDAASTDVIDQLRAHVGTSAVKAEPALDLLESGFWQFRRLFDEHFGGFGSAPKFPRPVVYNFLLRFYAVNGNPEALEMVLKTLGAMAAGGMHDQLGGGFHRYSVDAHWFVPHFEKMLYDQAQLAISYLEAFQITGDESLARTARDVFAYVRRDLGESEGGFYSAEDADSPEPGNPEHSREGAFYVWTWPEVRLQLGPQTAEIFARRFGIKPGGNVEEDPHSEFGGQNILYQAEQLEPGTEAAIGAGKELLFEARTQRPRPHLDNKVLTAWNALMISAFAKGYLVLHDRSYLDVAERAAKFIHRALMKDGVPLRRFCEGEASVEGFLDDVAFLLAAFLDLFEATGDADYLREAVALATRPLSDFEDEERGGFFSTRKDAPDLVLRVKDDYDGAEPSGNSIATDALLRLAHITGNDTFRERAEHSLASFTPKLKAQPTMAPQMLVAVGRFLTEPSQVVIRCAEQNEEVQRLLQQYRKTFSPYGLVFALTDNAVDSLRELAPFLAGLNRQGRITVYECRNFACALPQVIE